MQSSKAIKSKLRVCANFQKISCMHANHIIKSKLTSAEEPVEESLPTMKKNQI